MYSTTSLVDYEVWENFSAAQHGKGAADFESGYFVFAYQPPPAFRVLFELVTYLYFRSGENKSNSRFYTWCYNRYCATTMWFSSRAPLWDLLYPTRALAWGVILKRWNPFYLPLFKLLCSTSLHPFPPCIYRLHVANSIITLREPFQLYNLGTSMNSLTSHPTSASVFVVHKDHLVLAQFTQGVLLVPAQTAFKVGILLKLAFTWELLYPKK